MAEEREDEVVRLLKEIQGTAFWIAVGLIVIALLLAAIVFGFAEVAIKPA